jgi:hypothetical protein
MGVDDEGRPVLDVPAEPTGYAVPQILLRDDEIDPRTEREIATIFVFKKAKDGRLTYLGWKSVGDLPDLDTLLRSGDYGPGSYKLQGRGADLRAVIREVFVTCGDVDEDRSAPARYALPPPRSELDVAKIVTSVASALAPLMQLWQTVDERRRADDRERRERDEARDRERREQEREFRERELTLITQALTSRNIEMSDMVKAMLSTQAAAPGGNSKAYKDGQEDALAMLATLREEGMLGDPEQTQLLNLVQSFVAGARAPATPVHPPPPPPPPPPAVITAGNAPAEPEAL